MKVFLYDDRLDLGSGILARVDGFKLVVVNHSFSNSPEAIRSEKKSIYGYVYEINEDVLEYLDAYYGVGVGLHERIKATASLEGGVTYDVIMYECSYDLELV